MTALGHYDQAGTIVGPPHRWMVEFGPGCGRRMNPGDAVPPVQMAAMYGVGRVLLARETGASRCLVTLCAPGNHRTAAGGCCG